jgi:hypothetical protein
MAVTFWYKIALRPRSVFCFGTISSMADEEGILHRIADPLENKPSPTISEKARTRQQIAQPLAPRMKTTSCKSKAGNSFTRRTPLSTSSTEEWTRITRKKRSKQDGGPSSCSFGTFTLKEGRKEIRHRNDSFLPQRPLHWGESRIISHLR